MAADPTMIEKCAIAMLIAQQRGANAFDQVRAVLAAIVPEEGKAELESALCTCAEVEGEDPNCVLHWGVIDWIMLLSAEEALRTLGPLHEGGADEVRRIALHAMKGAMLIATQGGSDAA